MRTSANSSMLESDPAFQAIQRRDGYPRLEDLSLIGDDWRS
jgi:hypothetical protein